MASMCCGSQEDRLWLSRKNEKPSNNIDEFESLPLCDCEKVMEGDDKRLLQLQAKDETLKLRARSGQDRNGWFLAIVRQAALVKERDLLLQAERIISGVELRRSTVQLSKLDALQQLPGVLAAKETRDMFLDFARDEHQASVSRARGKSNVSDESSVTEDANTPPAIVWPETLTLESLVAHLERLSTSSGRPEAGPSNDGSAAWAFAEDALFPRFCEYPASQRRICAIAAGTGRK